MKPHIITIYSRYEDHQNWITGFGITCWFEFLRAFKTIKNHPSAKLQYTIKIIMIKIYMRSKY